MKALFPYQMRKEVHNLASKQKLVQDALRDFPAFKF